MTTSEFRKGFPAPNAIENPELIEYRAEFPILRRKTYLNSCSLGALSTRSMQGLETFMEMWNEWGAHAWYEIWLGEIAKVREKFASLIGAQLHEVAIAPNVSTALGSIANALDYSKRNKVVLAEMDFPTLAYQWLVKERLGVECQFVSSPDHIYTPPELFEDMVDEKTALVATSRVFFTSGYIQDARAVADIAHKHRCGSHGHRFSGDRHAEMADGRSWTGAGLHPRGADTAPAAHHYRLVRTPRAISVQDARIRVPRRCS
jgi:kynureninase